MLSCGEEAVASGVDAWGDASEENEVDMVMVCLRRQGVNV